MSRNKHRGAGDFIDGLKNAEKYQRIFERERRNREAWDSLTRRQQIAAMNADRVNGSPMSRAIAMTQACCLPMCDEPTITLAGQSLGICYKHAIPVEIYMDINTEDFEVKVARVKRHEAAARRQRIEERQFESRLLSPGWIYYLLVADRIKIGYTIDVKRRLKSYPPGSPLLAVHPGTKRLEHEMYAKFVGSRAAGREWFLDTPELREHIKEVIDQFGEPDRARYEHHGTGRSKSRLKAS